MSFEQIIGNENNKKILTNIENPSHAYLFIGPEGIGKFLFAKEFAKKLLCEKQEESPCEECKSCMQFNSNNHTDFNVIEPEENSIKIEQIRPIIEKVLEKPIVSKRKIYIINDADKMTNQAQNCLLKVLEEPPQYAIIILIGAEEHSFLNTIRSRCIKIKFEKIQEQILKQYLQEYQGFGEISSNILKIYDGSIKKALELKGKEEAYLKLDEFFNNIEQNSKIDCLKIATYLQEEKQDIKNKLEYINILLYKLGITNIKYLRCIEKVNKTISKQKLNCNQEMILDVLLLEIWEEINT